MTVQTQTLDQMRADVYECNEANGWFGDERAFDDDKALLHSEVSEMFEAYRDHGYADMTSNGGPKDAHGYRINKPLGFGSECADVLVRLLDTSFRTGIQFQWESLADVPNYPGFSDTATIGGHITALHGLIADIRPRGRSLDATLSYLTTWCRHLNIDLLAEFDRKLAFNRTRGHKHGGKLI